MIAIPRGPMGPHRGRYGRRPRRGSAPHPGPWDPTPPRGANADPDAPLWWTAQLWQARSAKKRGKAAAKAEAAAAKAAAKAEAEAEAKVMEEVQREAREQAALAKQARTITRTTFVGPHRGRWVPATSHLVGNRSTTWTPRGGRSYSAGG